MSGKIIEFRGRRDLRQARLDRQVARISGLLGELEDLTRDGEDLPSALLARARAGVARTGRILQPGPRSAAGAGPEEHGEGDLQPDIDRDLLERMYRHLALHA